MKFQLFDEHFKIAIATVVGVTLLLDTMLAWFVLAGSQGMLMR